MFAIFHGFHEYDTSRVYIEFNKQDHIFRILLFWKHIILLLFWKCEKCL